jgi:multidrug efflux pump subunit AcrA (membrane-fusion protein)
LQVDAFPGRKFPGKILRISPVVDRLSRTFQVEVIVPNAERALRPGGFAKGDVLTRVDSEAITAPRAAVYTFVGTARVFAVHDGKVRMVPVSPGVESPATSAEPDGWIELVNADRAVLSPGTLVVTTGHSQLSDGTPVVLRQTESAERPPATSRGGEAQR